MKIYLIVLLSIFVLTGKANAQENKSTKSDKINKIEVIDFHSTHRCITCKAIEENTKFTLEKYFSNELEAGKITFQIINVDDEENSEIAEKFEASGTSLFLNIIKNGSENKLNLTKFAFMNGRNKEVFSEKLKSKITKEVENL